MTLLMATQAGTCVFSLLCSVTMDLAVFWSLSLVAMVFKASYLLIYPYALSEEEKSGHLGTISLLAFVVYFGSVLSSFVSGAVLEYLNARSLFLLMAAGDVVQIALCWWWVKLQRGVVGDAERTRETRTQASARDEVASLPKWGALMLVLYFSAYVTEPFFSSYWESIRGEANRLLSGAVFAVPAVAALAGVWVNSRLRGEGGGQVALVRDASLGVLGLGLQASGLPLVVLVGRLVYGWALFQVMVRLDHVVFQGAQRTDYASVFARMNTFQGAGVLLASLAASRLIESVSPVAVFVVSAVGFSAGTLVLWWAPLRKSEPLVAVLESGANE
jgi:predicted MFS family arabinose efflux permease